MPPETPPAAAGPWESPWNDAWDPNAAAGAAITRKAAEPEDPKLLAIIDRHQNWTDTLIGEFEQSLKTMVAAASEKTLAKLKAELVMTDGAIEPTAANDKVLAGADSAFMDALNAEGYQELLTGYTEKFPGQLPYLQEMLNAMGESLGRELPAIDFSPTDLKVLGRIEATTVDKLDRLFSGAASIAMDRAMFSVAGLPFQQLVSTLADQMDRTLAAARTWADTAVTTWYRTAGSLTFAEIQKATPEALKFRYSGPFDIKNREFCKALLIAEGSYTKEEIGAMDNGQLPNAFLTCGGYNCRHIWVLAK